MWVRMYRCMHVLMYRCLHFRLFVRLLGCVYACMYVFKKGCPALHIDLVCV